MVLTGTSCPAFVWCKLPKKCFIQKIKLPEKWPDEFKWVRYDYRIEDPNSAGKCPDRHMVFTNVIGMEGKFYALSSQGTLAIVECEDSEAKIVAFGGSRAVPSASWRRCWDEENCRFVL